MSDHSATEPGRPPERVVELLYSDASGEPDGFSSVVEDARDDGRWRQLVAPVADLMHDHDLAPVWRWDACRALCSWADPAGYDAVLQTCAAPERAVWRGVEQDRFGRDTTFGELAEAVGNSRDLAAERGTGGQRLGALRAMLAVADRVDLVHGAGQGIADVLLRADVLALDAELRAAIAVCERALASGSSPVDIPVQLAGLIGLRVQIDEPGAVEHARRLLLAHPSRDVLVWLGTVVAGGRGEESLLLAEQIARTGEQEGVDSQVSGALASRRHFAADDHGGEDIP